MSRLVTRIRAKLRGKRGESIAETLIGLLISSLALVMLAGAVSSAANIVKNSRQAMRDYYESGDITSVRRSWSSAIQEAIEE